MQYQKLHHQLSLDDFTKHNTWLMYSYKYLLTLSTVFIKIQVTATSILGGWHASANTPLFVEQRALDAMGEVLKSTNDVIVNVQVRQHYSLYPCSDNNYVLKVMHIILTMLPY